MIQTFGDHAEGERLNPSDGLVSILTIGIDPDRSGTSASQRPSSSRSISIVKVTLAMYPSAGCLTR